MTSVPRISRLNQGRQPGSSLFADLNTSRCPGVSSDSNHTIDLAAARTSPSRAAARYRAVLLWCSSVRARRSAGRSSRNHAWSPEIAKK
ncbi:MAG: hypothetical protein WBA97_38845 [Actinophytocola sp.]|uniref:hypothetical protein n=1 Tax=Actinophytocola sp. TaxID=1872138 RepID=UPI003C74D885